MSIELISEVWALLKENMEYGTRRSSADDLINLLIDYDFSPSEIKQAFRRDTEMMDALADYKENHHSEDDEDEEYDDEEYDDDDDDNW